MTYMFVYPLIGGAVVNLVAIVRNKITEVQIFYVGKTILNYGIATLVVGSFMKGVFEIAGTGSDYLAYYFYVGIVLIFISLSLLLYSFYRTSNKD